jgi:FAD/FMN-containing dehydrogenase
MKEWINWSGSLKFTPTDFLKPENEDELREIIKKSYASGRKVRLAAAGHSSSPLVETPQTLVHLQHFKEIVRYDKAQQTATLKTGMTVHESAAELQKIDLALFNTGDVDVQTLAGAIATGTHGSGRKLQNLASVLDCVRLIDYKGDVRMFSRQHHPDMMKAMRVSLGALGIFTEITVHVLPAFKLKRLELCTDIETCLDHFDHLADENRNVDFYWYPRSDEAKIRILNEPGKGSKIFPFQFSLRKEEEGWAGEVLPRKRDLKFDEMEYALPAESGLSCFRAVRNRMKEKHRKEVAWRVLVRTIASDDNYLSPHYGRDSVSISLHHNAGLPFEEFFRDIEPIFIDHGGRPHWAKKHYLKGTQLRKLYPEWNKFQEIRKSLDPEGFFMNDHLREIFECDQDA